MVALAASQLFFFLFKKKSETECPRSEKRTKAKAMVVIRFRWARIESIGWGHTRTVVNEKNALGGRGGDIWG